METGLSSPTPAVADIRSGDLICPCILSAETRRCATTTCGDFAQGRPRGPLIAATPGGVRTQPAAHSRPGRSLVVEPQVRRLSSSSSSSSADPPPLPLPPLRPRLPPRGSPSRGFPLLVLLVEEDAAAVRAELDALAEADGVHELGRQDHVAARADALGEGHDAEAGLALDDALELEEDVFLEAGGDLLLLSLELLQLGVLFLDLQLDLGLLFLDVLFLLADHHLFFFEGVLQLLQRGLLPLQLLAQALLLLRGVLDLLVQGLVLALRLDDVHLAFGLLPALLGLGELLADVLRRACLAAW